MLETENTGKIKVNFFQRKPRKGFSFSIESVFEDLREALKDRIEAKVYLSGWYNDGYLSKFLNTVEAAFRQGDAVNHITGEVHFINLLMKKTRVLLTIHDCGMMNRKTGLAKSIVQWLYLSGPAKKATFITTISENSKQDIIKYAGCDPGKIHVIGIAVDSAYVPNPKIFNKEKPVILQIGTAYNKNLFLLIEAIKGVRCHLSIIGKLSEEQLTALASNNIDYSNEYNVSSGRMLEKYQECDLLAFISTAEGFGMPIVEANVVERPVITSNLSSMPEVAGDAACLVDPFDVEAIRSGILKIINDDAYRNSLVDAGKMNKLRFDRQKIANQYLELYKKIETGI